MSKKIIIAWFCVASFVIGGLTIPFRTARGDMFGADVAVLVQILAETIQQIGELESIIGSTNQTASILEEMNRGVKDVLRLANTAHVTLPPQVYAQAMSIDQATRMAESVYGSMPNNALDMNRDHYQSGVEGLYLSEDAFDYSILLDNTAEKVKTSAVAANEAAATKLTAETLGVVVEAVSHSNRIQAKNLEISSTTRLESSAKENANYESFLETHDVLSNDFQNENISPLNSFGDQADQAVSQ